MQPLLPVGQQTTPTRPSQCTRRGGSRPFGVRAAIAVEMDELPLRRSDVTDHNSLNL